jgi:hypothetical protein
VFTLAQRAAWKWLALLVALMALASAAVAEGATSSLRVLRQGRATGQFAIVSASGSKAHARAMYLRAYGHGLSGFVVTACSRGLSVGSRSQTLSSMVSGRLYKLRLPNAGGDCDVTASLSGSGSIRLQVLA